MIQEFKDGDEVRCAECDGSGYDPDFRDGKCRECGGTGRMTYADFKRLFPQWLPAEPAARP